MRGINSCLKMMGFVILIDIFYPQRSRFGNEFVVEVLVALELWNGIGWDGG